MSRFIASIVLMAIAIVGCSSPSPDVQQTEEVEQNLEAIQDTKDELWCDEYPNLISEVQSQYDGAIANRQQLQAITPDIPLEPDPTIQAMEDQIDDIHTQAVEKGCIQPEDLEPETLEEPIQ